MVAVLLHVGGNPVGQSCLEQFGGSRSSDSRKTVRYNIAVKLSSAQTFQYLHSRLQRENEKNVYDCDLLSTMLCLFEQWCSRFH